MADIRIKFEDGTEHVYQGVPDSVTPDQIQARVAKDFADKAPTHIARENVGGKPKAEPKKELAPHAMDTEAVQKGGTLPEGFGKGALKGMIEAGRSIVQGVGASAAGGLAGLTDLARGRGLDAAANRVRDVQGRLSYTPESTEGRGLLGLVAKPFEMASSGLEQAGGAIGGAIGGPKGEAIGEALGKNALDIAGAVAGGAGVARGAIRGANVAPNMTQTQRALQTSKQAGYAVNPVDVNPNIVNQTLGAIANKGGLDAELALKNAAVDTQKAKQALGIPKEKDLNYDTLAAARQDAEAAYAKLKKQDLDLTPDDPFIEALRNVDSSLHEAKSTYPELFKDNKLENIRSIIANPAQAPSPAVVVQTIQKLRKDASTIMKRSDLSPDEANAAMAMKNTATVLEDFMERKVGESRTLPPDVVQNFKAAREKFAKSFDVEEILNPETGTIDAAKLARNQGMGSKLTGPLTDVVQAQRAREPVKGAPKSTVRASDSVTGHAAAAGLGALAGSPLGPAGSAAGAAAGLLVPAATRKVMTSRLYQKYMTNPSPELLQQIREIDPKAAAALSASSYSGTPSKLPPKMENQE